MRKADAMVPFLSEVNVIGQRHRQFGDDAAGERPSQMLLQSSRILRTLVMNRPTRSS